MRAALDEPASRASGLPPTTVRGQRGALAVLGVGLALGVIALVRSDENAIGEFGLIQALPPMYYVAVAVVIGTLVWALGREFEATSILASGVVALVILVQGSATLVESAARFPTAWVHAAFTESIIVTGHASPNLDARFSWPGFFAGAGTLTDVSGVGDPTVWLRWASVVLLLCYLPPLLVIGRATLPGWRGPWIGLIVFVMVDWVGQDYFAPQTIGFILYLVIIAVSVTWLRRVDAGVVSARIQGWAETPLTLIRRQVGDFLHACRRTEEPAEQRTTSGFRVAILIVTAFLVLALVGTHQLTPAALIVVLFLLAILGRLRPWPMVGFTFVAMLGWLSYGAEPFWSGHLSQIFGNIGKIDEVFGSGVESRVAGSPAHLFVVKIRMIFALAVWGLALLGVLRLWKVGRKVSVPLLVLLAGPGFVLVSQSYGGEGVLRLFYYSLPGAAMLIGGLFAPRASNPGRRWLAAAGVTVLLLFPALLVAKWGNEAFERVSVSDLQIERALLDVAPSGSTVVSLGYGGATTYDALVSFNSRPDLLVAWPLTTVAAVNKAVGDNPIGTFVIIERPQVAFGVINDGLPPEFADQLVAMLLTSKQYKIVYQNPSGVILERIGGRRTSPRPPGAPDSGVPPIAPGGAS